MTLCYCGKYSRKTPCKCFPDYLRKIREEKQIERLKELMRKPVKEAI